ECGRVEGVPIQFIPPGQRPDIEYLRSQRDQGDLRASSLHNGERHRGDSSLVPGNSSPPIQRRFGKGRGLLSLPVTGSAAAVRPATLGERIASIAMKLYYLVTVPISIVFILNSSRIHPSYRMTFFRKLWLGLRMFWNKHSIPTGTSFKCHLAMALKILETPPDLAGEVVECGTWKGGSAANLSLVCKIVGRKLRVYDSF